MATEVKLADNIILRPSKDGRSVDIVRDGEVIRSFSFLTKTLYISIDPSNKPETEAEAEARVGKDVVKITPKDFVKYKKELGLIPPIPEEEKERAYKTLALICFDHSYFDSFDRFAAKCRIFLTKDEWNAVKKHFYYDADCEEWLIQTSDTKKVIKELVKVSERFAKVHKYIARNFLVPRDELLAYLRCYEHRSLVIDYDAGWDKTYRNVCKKYGFTGNTQVIEKSSSLSGYNLGTLEVEKKPDKLMIVYSHAVPPDDYCIEVGIFRKEFGDYMTMLKVARIKGAVELASYY